ncbi:hypothetical protein [Kordiimonas gwangyangensis]|uniref:hypothetical protein n=1 Tax=Kordiimonas gwangyangensis TaxID=288022 RepID=UPI000A6FA757|nr:hypothetical protein [Kordiimonas gwangyangensis]
MGEFTDIRQDWSNAAWGLGKVCTLRTMGESFTGTPRYLAEDGGLVVLLDDGQEKRLYAGDIFPVAGLE